MRRAVVTGSGGLIGSAVAARLEADGWHVDRVDSKRGRSVTAFTTVSAIVPYELAVHCAATTGGRQLIEARGVAHAVNLECDAQMFTWAELARPARMVYLSSVAAYPARLQLGDHRGRLLAEDDINLHHPELPDELYGWAKLTGEQLAARCTVPVTVVRPFTVYGPGQDEVHPFASLMAQVARKADPLTVWGTGSQARDFIDVADAARVIITLAAQEVTGPVNLCTGRAVTLTELAQLIAAEHGYHPAVEPDRSRPEGLPWRVGDPSRLNEVCPPRISLEAGIALAIRAGVP